MQKIKIVLKFILCAVFVLNFILVQNTFAQKRRPTTRRVVVADSTRSDSLRSRIEQADLPTLDLKEYTITGQSRIRILPSKRGSIDIVDITSIEKNAELEGKADRNASGSETIKQTGNVLFPTVGIKNEAYGSFGNYSNINAGVKLKKKADKDEYFGDFDFETIDGHTFLANRSDFKANLSNMHSFSSTLQSKSNLDFAWNKYNFYGAAENSNEERTGFNAALSNVTDISKWSPASLRFESGVRYFNPDASDIFNWDLWAGLYWSTIYKSTYFRATLEANTDRVKQKEGGNAPISTSNFAKAVFSVEKLLSPRLHVKIGGSAYKTSADYAGYSYTKQAGQWRGSQAQPVLDKNTKFYPNLSVRYDLKSAGRIFVEFDPSITPVTLTSKLSYNPYLNLTSPISYENTTHNLKIGWRRSYVYNFSFEIFYSDRKVENYGIIDDTQFSGINTLTNGRWSYIYGNDVNFNEYKAILNWSPEKRFNIWTSLSYSEYTISKSEFATTLPYFPKFTFDTNIQYFPGRGFQILLDSQYIGDRQTSAFDIATENVMLESFVLANLTVNKQINDYLGIYAFGSNLFNETYYLWRGYLAPDLTAGFGLRYFW